MNLEDFQRADPFGSPLWSGTVFSLASALFGLTRTRVVIEGLGDQLDTPAIVAMNHSHKYDWLPVRHALWTRHRMNLVTWIKARAYRGLEGVFLRRTGNIPLSSRGYLIASEHHATRGRRPTEAEYRALRAHVDAGEPLPDDLQRDPGYRAEIRERYAHTMQATLLHARSAMARGHHMHIYPQGSVSSRLTPGRVGVIQAALALELPIVPLAVSGAREALWGPIPRGGTITIRVGAARRVAPDLVPQGFRPFHADHEHAQRFALQGEVDRLMERLNALLDPPYRWAPDRLSDAKRGVARFY
jgi:1-acyl-sn-glycerol-3-phosphate acyltransferase